MKYFFALAAIALLFIGIGCSGAPTPTLPDKGNQVSMQDFFNSFEITSPVVGEFTYKDYSGNVLATGTLGRNDDGSVYIIEARGAQCDIDISCLSVLHCWIVYEDPRGTIPSGPNAGLPYYYLGDTFTYDINLLSLLTKPIGGWCPPFGWYGPAELTAEMHEAYVDGNGVIKAGPPMKGDYSYEWTGIINPGYMIPPLTDTYYICPGNVPGMNVTTVEVEAPIFFGCIDIIFLDCICGVWDPQ